MPAITALPIGPSPICADRREAAARRARRARRAVASRREEPQHVLAPSSSCATRASACALKYAALVEAGQVQRRHARPPEQPRATHHTSAATASVAALAMRVARHLRHPLQSSRTRGRAGGRGPRGARRALVPRRHRRLRAAPERVRRPRSRAAPRCRCAATTISRSSARSTAPTSPATPAPRPAGRRTCSAPPQRSVAARPSAARPNARASSSSTAARAIPVWDYVLSEQVALISILETTAPLVLVGHSHVALGDRLGRGGARRGAWRPRGPSSSSGPAAGC